MATKFVLLVLLGALTCTSNARRLEMIKNGGVDMEEKFWHHFPHFGGGLGFGHVPSGGLGTGSGVGFGSDAGQIVGGSGGGGGVNGGPGGHGACGSGVGGGASGGELGAGNP
ncbi:hypothetical protein Acr_15g0018500 [Actinidia rufa]|uniref:Glycine-rich protein n=1 Tax=Actinidia rufa TaxID=165716 RepID=A0A7J0FX17_9ERIC|nr:hypothetical protein Acr_15g0018500 [Actinidia rufa]